MVRKRVLAKSRIAAKPRKGSYAVWGAVMRLHAFDPHAALRLHFRTASGNANYASAVSARGSWAASAAQYAMAPNTS
jgi:hypothetical protein